jgi:alpha-ketoglutaric semialdehyde dehydrogenase
VNRNLQVLKMSMLTQTPQGQQPEFSDASPELVNETMERADRAFSIYKNSDPNRRAEFLEEIGRQITALGDELVQCASAETSLPPGRMASERARTVNQLRMFAESLRDGRWVDAVIDHGDPNREPVPKPDLRRMLVPLGPVVVFAASNFPLAFSVAGNDTASALAACNSVVVKAHPGHPKTSAIVAKAVKRAIQIVKMPENLVAVIHGVGHEVGLSLVRHHLTRAVGFTGSLTAGRALFNAAAARPQPIPVYAEMGSTNPVFILPGALQSKAEQIGESLAASVCLGVGQFCTNPGLLIAIEGEGYLQFHEAIQGAMQKVPPSVMLNESVHGRFVESVREIAAIAGLQQTCCGASATRGEQQTVTPVLNEVAADDFLLNEKLQEEVFGPSTLLVRCSDAAQMRRIASALAGQLTTTFYAESVDWPHCRQLIPILQEKAGRLVFGGVPTGVEVCPAMVHGGPYPASTDSKFTSVGAEAIRRFLRPVCFQNFPETLLPLELQEQNPTGITRWVDGELIVLSRKSKLNC